MRHLFLGLTLLTFSAPAIRAADLAAYSGNYASPNGHVIAVAEWEVEQGAPHVLAYTDLTTGRIGVLEPSGGNTFTLGSGILGGRAVATVRFEEGKGGITGLEYRAEHALPQSARRVPMRRDELIIHAAGGDLAGTLFIPDGKGPFPAVVIVPAGKVHRTAAATFPNFFLSQGLAVLAYDRRSEFAPFDTYAGDAVAAVNMLRAHKMIDGKRIGVWGHSQGGWLSLIAAAKSDSIAFVIDHSGMLVPAWQQELYRLSAEALAGGVEPTEVSAAVAYEAELMQVAKTGVGWDALMAKLQSAAKSRWVDLVYRPASLDELQRIWANDFSFDPRPFAARVHQPVLALFGGLDRSTPIESAANLVNAQENRRSLSVRFFPTANHAFLDAITGSNKEIPTLSHFAPGMFDVLREWLRLTLTSAVRQPARPAEDALY